MIVFDQLWVVLLAPLPLLIVWLASVYQASTLALRAPFFKQLVSLTGQTPSRGGAILKRSRSQYLSLLVTWLWIICALAKPMWLGDAVQQQQSARDLMIAVDLSGSMEAEDFTFADADAITRLQGIKQVIASFVEQRKGDSLGLIVFGSAAYLQVPFTLDHRIFKQLLGQTQARMAGPKTMLGDAIGLAVKHFSSADSEFKVLILLTDGNDSGSRVPPLDAARVGADQGIVIHTVAVGDARAVGEQELDISSLKNISRLTGGEFYHAQNGGQLQDIYNAIDSLEPRRVQVISHRPKTALFHWPLAIALLMQLLWRLTGLFYIYRKSETVRRDGRDA